MFIINNKSVLVVGFAITFILIAFSTLVYADDVKDSIKEALEYYDEGDYSGAVESLNYATQLIQQKKSENLTSFLPEPLDGWTAEKSTSQAVGAAMFGGGVTAERRYTKDDSNITVQIVTDSPMLQTMMMLFTNPMFAASDGGKMERIKRQKAIVKYDPSTEQGEIQIVVAKRFLVTINGNNISKDDLKAYAKGIDYKKLSAI